MHSQFVTVLNYACMILHVLIAIYIGGHHFRLFFLYFVCFQYESNKYLYTYLKKVSGFHKT